MKLTGKVIQILPLQSGVSKKNGNGWVMQQFVIETNEQYPKKAVIDLFGEEVIRKNPVAIDDVVTVDFYVESREAGGRWFTSIKALSVTKGAHGKRGGAVYPDKQVTDDETTGLPY